MFRNENYEDEIRDKDVIYPDIEQWDKTKTGVKCNGKYEGYNSRKCPHESKESRAKRRRLNMEQHAQ
ncbi:hypothetical protein F2Q68_00039005 [Brassica cretica]|uniref:Uncharacterized protein n=2 Tax=Brassica cretica TaxID=69181 RepID=A0A8S9MEU8_BRACR|nr:hypothetical protein F2Q68_00039005 [Brassica cretica]KAF3493701.1 hypothetical protein DY000_02052586 [Brassica cretica]